MALALVVVENRLLKLLFFLLIPIRILLTFNLRQHIGGLLASHHGDARIGPHKKEAGIVSATTHAVIAGAEGAAD